jgi:hypothetical protein
MRQRPRRSALAPSVPQPRAGGSRELERARHAPHEGPVGDGSTAPQEAVVTPGASVQVEGEDALEELGPPPARRGGAGFCLAAWLAGRWRDGAPQLAGCCPTAPLPDRMHPRRRAHRSPLLQPLYGDRWIPIVPSDQARVKVERTSPLASGSRRSRDTGTGCRWRAKIAFVISIPKRALA